MVATTVQLHSIKPELRFRAGSNPAHGMSEIHSGVIMTLTGNKAKCLLSVNHATKTIHYHHLNFFKIGIHSMQDRTATTRHGVTKRKNTKRLRLRHTGNLFRKNRQLKDVC